MKKWHKRTLWTLGGIVVVLLVLVVTLAFLLNTKSVQNRILDYSEDYLTEKLQTNVQIDSVNIDFLGQYVYLYGLYVEDQQQRPLLKTDTIGVHLNMWALLMRDVRVSKAVIHGLKAHLLKPSKEEPANYQFVIDAFKKDAAETETPETSDEQPKSVCFDLKRVELYRIHVTYNDNKVAFESLLLRKKRKKYAAELHNLQAAWTSHSKKGDISNTLFVRRLEFSERNAQQLTFGDVHFTCDNHLPRKNEGKPKRGSFDTGHFDLNASMQWEVQQATSDTVRAVLLHAEATDTVMGIDLRDLRLELLYAERMVHLNNVHLQQGNTTLHIDKGHLQMADSTADIPLNYSASGIKGHVVLQDIARLFAPVLSNFTLPLQLQADMSGTATDMQFSNVQVGTQDKRLSIRADGDIRQLNDKQGLTVHFNVHKMTAQNSVTKQILDLFPVKKLMMKQLDGLGTIGYSGDFTVRYRREEFRGTLTTRPGHLNFNFALDEANKYLVGTANANGFDIAQLFAVQQLGPVSFDSNFKIDISKPRTAQMRRLKGGKLPIGSVKGVVSEASYKKVTVRNLDVDIESDGAEAAGSVMQRGRHVDLSCNFIMTSTDSIRQVKVKPHISIHGLSDEDRQAKAERKEQRRQEKAERRSQKKQEKAERRAARKEEKQKQKEEQ